MPQHVDLHFGSNSPSFEREQAALQTKRAEEQRVWENEVKRILEKVYYDSDGERITGYDILSGIQAYGQTRRIKRNSYDDYDSSPKWEYGNLKTEFYDNIPAKFKNRSTTQQSQLDASIDKLVRELLTHNFLQCDKKDTYGQQWQETTTRLMSEPQSYWIKITSKGSDFMKKLAEIKGAPRTTSPPKEIKKPAPVQPPSVLEKSFVRWAYEYRKPAKDIQKQFDGLEVLRVVNGMQNSPGLLRHLFSPFDSSWVNESKLLQKFMQVLNRQEEAFWKLSKDDFQVLLFELIQANLMESRNSFLGNTLYRVTGKGIECLMNPKKLNTSAETDENAVLAENLTIDAESLGKQFHTEIEKLKAQQAETAHQTEEIISGYEAREKALQDLQEELKLKSSKAVTEEQKRQIKLFKAKVDRETQILDAMKNLADVAKANQQKFMDEIDDTVMKVEDALSRIELTRIKAQTLQLTEQLKEKNTLEASLEKHIHNVNMAFHTVKLALEQKQSEQGPEALLVAMKKARQQLDTNTEISSGAASITLESLLKPRNSASSESQNKTDAPGSKKA